MGTGGSAEGRLIFWWERTGPEPLRAITGDLPVAGFQGRS
jgi:hypothetical protein